MKSLQINNLWWGAVLALATVCHFGQVRAVASLATALDTTNLVWSSGGTAAWIEQTVVTHDGVDAVQSGRVFDGQESWLQTTVTGPGMVAFWWRVSSEMDADLLEFHLSGVRQSHISGEIGWKRVFFAVPVGTQTLRWRYVKDVGSSLGQDGAWVDGVVFQPHSGPPSLLAEPTSRIAGVADTVTFAVGAAGELPLNYQWFRDATNAVVGATEATLSLSNVSWASAGAYSVLVSNRVGTVVSGNAVLKVTTNGPVKNVLLLVRSYCGTSPYRTALDNLRLNYQSFADSASLGLAVSNGDPGTTLVVVGAAYGNDVLSPLADFANAGGRVLLEYWGLGEASPLAAALNATVVQRLLPFPRTAYDWGGSPFFAGSSSWLAVYSGCIYQAHGQRLQPAAGGRAVAGFTASSTNDQAAIVVGHAGRTILNSFLLEEATGSFTSSVPSSAAIRLAENQLRFLLPPPQIVVTDGSLGFHTNLFGFHVEGSSGQTVVVEGSSNLVNWLPLRTNTLGTNAWFWSDAESTNFPRRFYRTRSQ